MIALFCVISYYMGTVFKDQRQKRMQTVSQRAALAVVIMLSNYLHYHGTFSSKFPVTIFSSIPFQYIIFNIRL